MRVRLGYVGMLEGRWIIKTTGEKEEIEHGPSW